MKFEFWGQNGEISKIRDRRFENRSILRRLAFLMASYFKTKHSSSLETFAVFYPKWRNITSLKRSFSPFFSTDLPDIFVGNVKLMLGKVPTESFASIYAAVFELSGKSCRGGAESPPSQRGAC